MELHDRLQTRAIDIHVDRLRIALLNLAKRFIHQINLVGYRQNPPFQAVILAFTEPTTISLAKLWRNLGFNKVIRQRVINLGQHFAQLRRGILHWRLDVADKTFCIIMVQGLFIKRAPINLIAGLFFNIAQHLCRLRNLK